MPIVTQHPVTLNYFVRDIATELLTYNRIRWYRSRAGEDGPYVAATSAAAAAAVLTGTAPEPHGVVGTTLSFLVNGVTTVDITFTGTDPLTTANVVTQITAATALVVGSADSSGRLVLTTAATGSGASIKILESDAAALLGFQTDDAAVGTDADIVLVSGTHDYTWTDQNSDADFFYKTQFVHATTGAVSDLSVAIPASQVPVIPSANSVVCYVRLADMSGRPLVGRRITISNGFQGNMIAGFGVFRHHVQMTTDSEGYAEIRLLRGLTVDVSFDGTGFVRRITVPSTGDSVDLLSSSLVAEDEFGIHEADIDFAIRLS